MFSSSSAQWCSVNTTPSRGSARQLRRFTRVWHLEPARERFRRWMKTRVARPPYQVECSCQTTKTLSLSRAPYTPVSILFQVKHASHRSIRGVSFLLFSFVFITSSSFAHTLVPFFVYKQQLQESFPKTRRQCKLTVLLEDLNPASYCALSCISLRVWRDVRTHHY